MARELVVGGWWGGCGGAAGKQFHLTVQDCDQQKARCPVCGLGQSVRGRSLVANAERELVSLPASFVLPPTTNDEESFTR
jgi:hypothetical protein